MRLTRLRPEAFHGKALVEVCAEVIHNADGEKDVHAKLEDSSAARTRTEDVKADHLEDFEIRSPHFVRFALEVASRIQLGRQSEVL